MASELRVNSSTNRSGLGTITYTDSGPIVSGVGTFANGLTVDGTQTTVKSLKLTGDNYNANWFKTTNKLRFNDNAKATFGTADDLSIYHDGSHSILNDSQGSLLLRSNIVQISTPAGSKYFKGQSGAAELYYSDSIKFTTTNTGATITGKLTSDGLVLGDAETIAFGNTSNGDFKIYHDGSNGSIQNITGALNLFGGTNAIYLKAKNDENSIVCSPNAQVELYYDGIRTALTQQDALWVHGRTSNSGMVEIASNQGANNNDRFRIHKTSAASRLSIQNYSTGSWVENIRITAGSLVELKHADGTTKMHTDSTGITVANRITASGDTNTYINLGSTADTLDFYTGGTNYFRLDSSGRIVVNNMTAQDGAAKLQIKGGTAANILTADITDETVAVFGGSSPGTTQTGYGAGIVIKPIISRGSNFFLGACNSGANQEGNGYFVIRQGHLAANTTERLRINQNGQVEIQERLWIPSNKLLSLGNSAASPHFSFYNDAAGGLNHITSNSGQEIKVSSGNGDSNGIEFWDYTGNNKRCQIDGHGIKFNTDTAEANALDDYEEGSWTPAAYGFTISATYSARYTKIGRLVHINCYVQAASGSGTSLQPQISGLPFTSVSGNSYSYGAGRIGTGGYNNSQVDIAFQQQSNTNIVKFYVGGGGINESMMSGGHVIFSMVYEAA